jgi:nucleoporin NUP1
MFKPKPKRSRTPILMHSDKDDKPRLGRTRGREVNGTKPYAGEGGLKKLLARRKLEEEDERRKEKAQAMDDGREDEDEVPPVKNQGRLYQAESAGEKTDLAIENRQQDVPPTVLPVPTFGSSTSTPANYEKSSLRVSRTRTSRNHISRPTSRSNNRFSAVYDEEESDDQMLEEKSADQIALEDAAKKVPVFQVPIGFSFAKEVRVQDNATDPIIYSVPQIQHDLKSAREPPMSSLPFSFTKPPNGSTTSSISPPPSKEPEQVLKPASSIFAHSKAPSITLTTATPEHQKAITQPQGAASCIPNFFANYEAPKRPPSAVPPENTGSGVPNFFANSAALSKPISASAPATSSNVPDFFTNSAAASKPVNATLKEASVFSPHATPTTDAENPLWEGDKIEKPEFHVAESKPLSFGEVHKPTSPSSFGVSPTGSENNSIFNAAHGASHPTSVLASSVLPVPTREIEAVPATSVFGGVKPTALTPSPFQFGTPVKGNEPTQQLVSATEPLKVPEAAPVPVEAPKPPPLFGSAPVSSFAGFGGPTIGTTPAKAPKPPFSFGQTTSAAPTPIEAPKPVLGSESAGGFLFGQRPNSAPTPAARSSPANPFSFGAAPTTPPAGAEKKSQFTFAPLPVAVAPATNSTFSFCPPSSDSLGTDGSQMPFTFGSGVAAPARPITPPKNEQEFRMEESPTRDMNGKGAEPPKLTLPNFSFGAPGTSSTGSALFGQNNQGGSAPFSFGGTPGASGSNPFAAKLEEKQENKGLGFRFGQNTSGFSFGQKSVEAAPTTPSSAGGFSFGQAPAVVPTNISTSFAFGGSSNNNHPFSQSASNAGSAPNSPSTFNQSAPFSFSSPTAPSNLFAFGSSQPASPATNGNVSLPQAPGTPGGGFAFGQSSNTPAAQSTSPFQAPPAALPPVGSLFTIGSAPPPAPSGGGRAIKKLPNRRTGKR